MNSWSKVSNSCYSHRGIPNVVRCRLWIRMYWMPQHLCSCHCLKSWIPNIENRYSVSSRHYLKGSRPSFANLRLSHAYHTNGGMPNFCQSTMPSWTVTSNSRWSQRTSARSWRCQSMKCTEQLKLSRDKPRLYRRTLPMYLNYLSTMSSVTTMMVYCNHSLT